MQYWDALIYRQTKYSISCSRVNSKQNSIEQHIRHNTLKLIQNPETHGRVKGDIGSAGINSHHVNRPQVLLIIPKVTCPDAGLPFKHCSSVYAIPSALFPGQNVSLIGNSINSHEFTGNTILLKKDTVSLASHQEPI